jgi:diguanylate cyclase (GGDEF)-like protein
MSILIVDDSELSRSFIADMLEDAGYTDNICASSAEEAFDRIGVYGPSEESLPVDLVLLEINLPQKNGIEACQELKAVEDYADVPVIIISGVEHLEGLEAAFAAGAMDYITKPTSQIELLARVRSALQLKAEMDQRKAREAELLVLNERLANLNRELERMTMTDSLTGLANRRRFNEFLARDWRRAIREARPFAVLMIDIDCFKKYNDAVGHLAGDVCLQKVAMALQQVIRRPGDLLARYGGEEFVVALPDTDIVGASALAEACRRQVSELRLAHPASTVAEIVTISIGGAVLDKQRDLTSSQIVANADEALCQAKEAGRNCVNMTQL